MRFKFTRDRVSSSVIAAVLAAGTLVAVGGSPFADDRQEPVELAARYEEFDDGLNRFVVELTPEFATSVTGLGAAVEVDGISIEYGAAGLPAGLEPFEVVDRPAGEFRLVLPSTPEEHDFLGVLGDHGFLAKDDAGGVYGVLWESGVVIAAPTTPPDSADLSLPASNTVDAAGVTGPADNVDGSEPPESRFSDVTLVSPGVYAVTTEASLPEVLSWDGVLSAEPDVLLHPFSNDHYYPSQWAHKNEGRRNQAGGYDGVAGADMRTYDAWPVSRGSGIVVAVVDSGFDLGHPDLVGQWWQNPGEICDDGIDNTGNGFVDDCWGWDFGDNDNDPSFDVGLAGEAHGTQVTGVLAAVANNGIGIAGVAPDVKIMPLKRSAGGRGLNSAAAASIRYAVDNGADIINLSFGTDAGVARSAVRTLEDAIAYAEAHGVIVVVASGNSGINLDSNPVWPASFGEFYSNVIVVGASDNADRVASFSNTGSVIDVVAPGFMNFTTDPTQGYRLVSGTSIAAPHTAGAAAVVLSSGRASTPAAVRALLRDTAVPIMGANRVDMGAAAGIPHPSVAGSASATISGLDQIVADEPAGLELSVYAADAGVANVRLSFATTEDGAVVAVDQLAVTVDRARLVTGPDGALPPIAVPTGDGVFTSNLVLPEGSYAAVFEFLNPAGSPVAPPHSIYFDVGTEPFAAGDDSDGDGGSDAEDGPVDGDGGDGPAGSAVADPTDPDQAGDDAEAGDTGEHEDRGDGIDGSEGGDGADSGAAGECVTVAGVACDSDPNDPDLDSGTDVDAGDDLDGNNSGDAEDAAQDGDADEADPGSDDLGDGEDKPDGSDADADADGDGDGDGDGGVPEPTEEPDPVVSGQWRLDRVSPRTMRIDGGRRVTFTGRFPTDTELFVWFGDLVVPVDSPAASKLSVTAPKFGEPGVYRVGVKFVADGELHELIMDDAFTVFIPAGSTQRPPKSPRRPTPTPAAPSPGDGVGGEDSPVGPAAPIGDRGSLQLYEPSPGSVLSMLTPAGFSDPCNQRVCASQRIN